MKKKKDKFNWKEAERRSWNRIKQKYPGYTKDINISISDPSDLSKQDYIDKPNPNAKLINPKHHSKYPPGWIKKEAQELKDKNKVIIIGNARAREEIADYTNNIMRRLSIGDYYFCSLCQKWHRVPATGLGQEHLKFFDEQKTNSDAPEYYYCGFCRKPHHNKREHLTFKIHLYYETYNQNINQYENKLSDKNLLNHNDILSLIEKYIESKKEYSIWHRIYGTNSLPMPCTRESRLYLPDLILCKDFGVKKSFKSRYSISHIIEIETQTGIDFVIDKMKRANECIKIMMQQEKTQDTSLFPKLIFLYRSDAPINLDFIRQEARKLILPYLDGIIFEYWDRDKKWYELLHDTTRADSKINIQKSQDASKSEKYILSNKNDSDKLFESFWK